MGIFTTQKRRAEQAAQVQLTQAQANVNRLRMFLATIAAGLDCEGHHYAQRAIGVLVAIAGWPSLEVFVYQLGRVECDFASITNEDEGWRIDRTIAITAARLLSKACAEPIALADVQIMPPIACTLMVWWGLSDLAEPRHAVVRLMRHFGGHPSKSEGAQAIDHRLAQIRSRLTPQTHKMWKLAQQEMSTYGTKLPAA
jgi:hypothetical protein